MSNNTNLSEAEIFSDTQIKRNQSEPITLEAGLSSKQSEMKKMQTEPAPLTKNINEANIQPEKNQTRESEKRNAQQAAEKYEEQSKIAMNSEELMGTRLQAGANAVAEKTAEKYHEVKAEINKETTQPTYETEKREANIAAANYQNDLNRLKDSEQPIGTRLEAGVKAIGEKASELFHETKAGLNKETPQPTYDSEKREAETAGANFEVESHLAKDPEQTIGTRLEAGVKAIGEKVSEIFHEVRADAYKNPSEVHNNPQYTEERRQVSYNSEKYDMDTLKATNPSNPVTTRIEAGVSALGDKVAEKYHEAKAEVLKQTTTAD